MPPARTRIEAIRQKFPEIAISVDTYWPSVVRRTFDTIGPFIVNDVTAGEGMYNKSDEMLRTVAELGLPFVAMHMRGNPKTMQSLTEYDNVTAEVLDYFRQFASKAEAAGVKDWILDPGFGFAKTIEQNYQMLRELDHFAELGKTYLGGYVAQDYDIQKVRHYSGRIAACHAGLALQGIVPGRRHPSRPRRG